MNGHLQLSISLKNHVEIENAIKLLQSLLPSSSPSSKSLEHLRSLLPSAYPSNKSQLTLSKSEKARKNASKRKRDTNGHFVKEVKK